MPIGTTKPSFISQAIVDKLAMERSWPRRHPDWPTGLWPIQLPVNYNRFEALGTYRNSRSGIHEQEHPDPASGEMEADEIFGGETANQNVTPLLSTPEDVDKLFASKGAEFGLDIFKIAVCKRFGAPIHRSGLVRSGSNVFQLWYGPKTRQRLSVLGRIGSIDIICQGIEDELRLKAGIPRKHVTIGELARFVCGKDVNSITLTAKLLDRTNQGYFINDVNLNKICRKLRLVVEDVAFVHPTIFAGKNAERESAYAETRKSSPPQIPAMPWIGSERALYEFLTAERGNVELSINPVQSNREVRQSNIEAPNLDELSIKALQSDIEARQSDTKVLQLEQLKERIKSGLEACSRRHRQQAISVHADFSAWVSYIAGSGDGDPDGRGRLIITIDKHGAQHEFINL